MQFEEVYYNIINLQFYYETKNSICSFTVNFFFKKVFLKKIKYKLLISFCFCEFKKRKMTYYQHL